MAVRGCCYRTATALAVTPRPSGPPEAVAELDVDIETVFAWSVAGLSGDARQTFLDLAAVQSGTVSLETAYHLWSAVRNTGVTRDHFLSVLGERASLLECDAAASPAVLELHVLTHTYAARRIDPQRRVQLEEVAHDLGA